MALLSRTYVKSSGLVAVMTHGCGVITQKHTLAATASDLMKLCARRDTTTAVIVRLGNFHPVHARRLRNSLCVSEAGDLERAVRCGNGPCPYRKSYPACPFRKLDPVWIRVVSQNH